MDKCALLTLSIFVSFFIHAQEKKISYTASELLTNKKNTDSVDISLSLMSFSGDVLKNIRVLQVHKASNTLLGRIMVKDLSQLLSRPEVLFLNITTLPKEELSTGAVDYTLNKITYLQNKRPALKGDSIYVLLKERVFDTTDIDLKGRIVKTGIENSSVTAHATLMATIIGGAGNSSPYAKGVAPSCYLGSSSFLNLLPDPDSVLRKYPFTVQNHSYGTSVENFYGNEAFAYDVSALNNPLLLYVFSAGNSGNVTNTSGPYANITEMANLTGNFKQAKNILTVSAVDSMNNILPLSSKGPAYDGRVKPELVAYGEDGSSGASALVSGASVLVENAYKNGHANNKPLSQVTKAVLINSADDVGPGNVDFLTGYGSLNAFNAVNTILENRIIEGSLIPGEIKTVNLPVPANISKVKVTLVWNDVAATVNARKALVNDLDLQVRYGATGQVFQPWVLSVFPNKDSLLLPALRKTDTLNNVEQVTIDNPATGNYILELKGTKITTASQTFAVAYQFDTAGVFKWNYPSSSDVLMAGRTQVIRWSQTIMGAAQLFYSFGNNNWLPLGSNISLASNGFKWTLPDTNAIAVLKMVVGAFEYISDSFVISRQPFLQSGFNCTDSFLLYWNRLGIQQFQLYELPGNYLQPFALLPDTSILLYKNQHPSLFYAVAPMINNKPGMRSFTLNAAAAGCYLKSFYVQNQVGRTVYLFAELGTLYNVATVTLEKWVGNAFVPLQTLNPVQTSFNFLDSTLQRGANQYRLRILLGNNTIIYSGIETVFYTSVSEPVILYPNPVPRNAGIGIIAYEIGKYRVRIFDANGKFVYEQMLNSTYTNLSAGYLSKGMYLIQIIKEDGVVSVNKIIVL